MSQKYARLLHSIFNDPVSGNIHWREVQSLLHHLGAEVEPLSGARVRVRMNGVEGVLHHPHHSSTLDKAGVHHLRQYLAHAGASPSVLDGEDEA